MFNHNDETQSFDDLFANHQQEQDGLFSQQPLFGNLFSEQEDSSPADELSFDHNPFTFDTFNFSQDEEKDNSSLLLLEEIPQDVHQVKQEELPSPQQVSIMSVLQQAQQQQQQPFGLVPQPQIPVQQYGSTFFSPNFCPQAPMFQPPLMSASSFMQTMPATPGYYAPTVQPQQLQDFTPYLSSTQLSALAHQIMVNATVTPFHLQQQQQQQQHQVHVQPQVQPQPQQWYPQQPFPTQTLNNQYEFVPNYFPATTTADTVNALPFTQPYDTMSRIASKRRRNFNHQNRKRCFETMMMPSMANNNMNDGNHENHNHTNQQGNHPMSLDTPSMDVGEVSLEQEEKKLEKKKKSEMQEAINSTSSSLMQIVEGFITPASQKQCGGKDNREPLAAHIIRLDTKEIPDEYKKQREKLYIRAHLIGYKKLTKEKAVLSVLQQFSLTSDKEIIELTFDHMICKHSSHNHGQKLFIKFCLVDLSDRKHPKELQSIQSAEFETITKRGVEKQRQKKKRALNAAASTFLPSPVLESPTSSSAVSSPLIEFADMCRPSRMQSSMSSKLEHAC